MTEWQLLYKLKPCAIVKIKSSSHEMKKKKEFYHITTLVKRLVLYICVGFLLLAHLTHDLSRADEKNCSYKLSN
jgi:hypothetical protein